jgi:hypothetical protein
VSEGGAQIGQRPEAVAATEEQLCRPQRARGDDHRVGAHGGERGRGGRGGIEPLVAHAVTRAVRDGSDPVNAMERVDLGAVALGQGEVIEVERVLGVGGAAEHAVARVVARLLVHRSVGVPAPRSAVYGDGHELGGAGARGARARVEEGCRPGGKRPPGRRFEGGGVEHLVRKAVIRPERLEVDGGRPADVLEDGRRRAQVDVEVVERAAAHAASLDHVHAREDAVVKESEVAAFRIPERVTGDLARRAREVDVAPAPAALEHAHAAPGLGQPARRDAAAEARPDDDDVVARVHGRLPIQRRARRPGRKK